MRHVGSPEPVGRRRYAESPSAWPVPRVRRSVAAQPCVASAWRDDTELVLGPPKERALLPLLLTEAGHPVTVHEIVDAL